MSEETKNTGIQETKLTTNKTNYITNMQNLTSVV